jgi:outer membrane usher protein
VQAGQVARSIFLTYTLSLSERKAVVLSANTGAGPGSPDDELYATYVRSPPLGPGQGYRLGASSAGNYDAQWRDQLPVGDLELQAARNQGVAGTSLYWSGAATFLGGGLRAARQVNDSFALVDVAGLAGVPVYVDNQLVAHTDANGRALVRELRPYEANRIGVDPGELPLDTAIAARTLVLVPAYRSGVIARFPVERVAGGTFRLLTVDGVPVPSGAEVHFAGAVFPVALDGMTYVTGFDHGMSGEARWGEARCVFRLESPPPHEPLPDMGDVTCRAALAGASP